MKRQTSAAVLVAFLASAALVGGQTKVTAPKNKYTPAEDVKLGREAAAEVFAPSRDENIGITETTSAGQAGSEWAVTQRGEASDEDRWKTERDARVCPICSPLESRPRSEWQAKFPTGPPSGSTSSWVK